MRAINLFRALFVAFGLFMGMRVGDVAFKSLWMGGIAGLIFGLGVVLIDRLLKGFSLRIFSSATFGLILGLVMTRLLLASDVLAYTSQETRWVLGICVYGAFGYLGMMLAVRSNRDEFSLIIPYVRFQRTAVHDVPVLVDTSALIDGRIAAVCATGFLSTSLVVPRFVLDELQALADSAEPLKRERGKRGLDLLHEAQRRNDMALTIHDSEPDPDLPTDTRLIQVAQLIKARLLTNDANLARVARLEGVSVLSLSELSHALAPVISTGEELTLTLVKPGRDAHQAVGFLADGSMVVANHARACIGETVQVVVAGMIQTGTGRMYFAELKEKSDKANKPERPTLDVR